MRAVTACKSHRAALVRESVAGLVNNCLVIGLQLHVARRMAAALTDKIEDHTANERVGAVASTDIAQEVCDRQRRALRSKLWHERALAGRYTHARRGGRGEYRSDDREEQRRR